MNPSYFIYRFAQEIVVCAPPFAPRTERVTIAGHINEAGDVFAEDYPLPPVEEGEIVAILNAGGYHQGSRRPIASARWPAWRSSLSTADDRRAGAGRRRRRSSTPPRAHTLDRRSG